MAETEEKKRDEKQIEAAGEEEPKKLPYPKQVFFIVGNEFCERFSYYGMKAVLAIYLKSKLKFSEDQSTVIYHAFSGLCYFTPIFGAMLADQFFGKFKTIFWISLVYVLGHILKTLAAVTPLGLPPVEFSLIGLLLIALGTGGIKPCVAAFGGDQFKLPEQERQLQTFFSVFYFSINAGSLISTFITPIFRQDVQCFGDETCYSLAFGVPAILMLVATVILVFGKNMYIHKPPQGSVMTQVIGSIWYATKKRFQTSEKPEHWLDHAKGKYSSQLIADTKILLRLLVLYLPLPIYWALFDQQGSRWTFQATRMNGQVGSWIIKPDQMQLLNPAFILALIPTFDRFVYPFLSKFNILKKPLQRIVTGGCFTAAAFFISGFLELELAKTYGKMPQPGESHAHVMNLLPCDLNVRISNQNGSYNNHFDITAGLNSIVYDLKTGGYDIEVRANEKCALKSKSMSLPFVAEDKTVSGFLIRSVDDKLNVMIIREAEDPHKRDDAMPKFKVVFNANKDEPQKLLIRPSGIEPDSENDNHIIDAETQASYEGISVTPYGKIEPGTYDFYWNEEKIASEITLPQGGVHTFVINGDQKSLEEPQVLDFLLTKENSVHMLWLIPQFFVITVGEIMFSITALEFSYSQAPTSMKSVLQAVNLLTVAFGNVIVIIVAEAKAFDQASEFFLFACLMVLDMALLGFLAVRFTYVNIGELEQKEPDSESSGNNNVNNIPLEEKPSSSSRND